MTNQQASGTFSFAPESRHVYRREARQSIPSNGPYGQRQTFDATDSMIDASVSRDCSRSTASKTARLDGARPRQHNGLLPLLLQEMPSPCRRIAAVVAIAVDIAISKQAAICRYCRRLATLL